MMYKKKVDIEKQIKRWQKKLNKATKKLNSLMKLEKGHDCSCNLHPLVPKYHNEEPRYACTICGTSFIDTQRNGLVAVVPWYKERN